MGIATLSLLTRNIQPSEPASPPRILNRTHRRASQARTQTYLANMKIRLTSETDVKLHSPKQKQTFFSRPPGGYGKTKKVVHTLPATLPMFFGAGSGIRTHAALTGHRLSRPTLPRQELRLWTHTDGLIHSAYETQSHGLCNPGKLTRIQVREAFHPKLT